ARGGPRRGAGGGGARPRPLAPRLRPGSRVGRLGGAAPTVACRELVAPVALQRQPVGPGGAPPHRDHVDGRQPRRSAPAGALVLAPGQLTLRAVHRSPRPIERSLAPPL